MDELVSPFLSNSIAAVVWSALALEPSRAVEDVVAGAETEGARGLDGFINFDIKLREEGGSGGGRRGRLLPPLALDLDLLRRQLRVKGHAPRVLRRQPLERGGQDRAVGLADKNDHTHRYR
mgnify:CR=1 FL=1